MANTCYTYFGYSDTTGTPEHPNWKLTPDTPEELQKAIQEGYTAKTILSLKYEPEKGKPEPMRWGPLVLDFDYREDQQKAILAARHFVARLCLFYQLDPNHLRYWISGGKGCHIEIPEALIGSEEGSPVLAKIYSYMTRILFTQCLRSSSGWHKMIDMQLFNMGKGRLLRLPNIQRPNGRYKVPVSADEFMDLPVEQLVGLTAAPRPDFCTGYKAGTKSEALYTLFIDTKEIIELFSERKQKEALEAINRCAFLNHCIEDAEKLSEPEWWAFVSLLATQGKLGEKFIHIFSRPYPDYSPTETARKVAQANAENKPKTCAYIKQQGWVICPESCSQYCPCNLFGNTEDKEAAPSFALLPDGLYYTGSEKPLKICTQIKVINIASDYTGRRWGRVIEITDLLQNRKRIFLEMKELYDQGKWLAKLVDAGLILEGFSSARRLLQDYIINGESETEFVFVSDKIGWTPKGGYLLPDICYGDNEKTQFWGPQETKFNVVGTLADWKLKVGSYCSGNPLFVFALSFALSGIFLKPLQMESGGVHIFGSSSKGKSTVAVVCGSVCGGNRKDGFIEQWRTTDNALERIAAGHNDNLLVLDEVGQADGMTVSKIAYMLANGQGKHRSTADDQLRKVHTWNLNFLSTGELTIGDKIREDNRLRVMAGQEVRIIDIPVDGGNNENSLVELHGFASSKDLSDELKRNAKSVYGTPLRAFLEIVVAQKEEVLKEISAYMQEFIKEHNSSDFAPQVQRALHKFALIAATGELATDKGIFPFQKGEAMLAAAKEFKAWLVQRNGVQDSEIIAAIERIRQHFESCSSAYVNLEEGNENEPYGGFRKEIIGYKFQERPGYWVYFTLTPTLKTLVGNANRLALREELEKLKWLAYNSSGNLLETKSYDGKNMRGWGFIPSKIK